MVQFLQSCHDLARQESHACHSITPIAHDTTERTPLKATNVTSIFLLQLTDLAQRAKWTLSSMGCALRIEIF